MEIIDLKIIETGSGGDLVLVDGEDLGVITDNSNQVYLSTFGGNVKENTEIDAEQEIKEHFDWWGNVLLFPEDELSQMNSNTERALINNSLTSSGRVEIENAVIADTKYLEPETIEVTIPDVDRVNIKTDLGSGVEFNFEFEDSI